MRIALAKLAPAVFALIACLIYVEAQAQGSDHTGPERPVLFVGNELLPPLNFMKDGEPAGLAVDLARALAKRMRHPVEVRLMSWAEAQQMVLDGRADALIQINASPERSKTYDFSDPLLTSEFSIFTSRGRPDIKSVQDLRDLKVGVERMGLPDFLLRHDPRILVEYIPDFAQGFRMLAAGNLDAIVVDRRVGSYVLAEHKIRGVRLVEEPVSQSDAAIAVKKGNARLLEEINAALANIRFDGTYNEILKSWQTKEVVFKTIEQLRYERLLMVFISAALILALASIVIMGRQNQRLKRLEAALRESEEKFRTIFENAPLGLFRSTPEGRFIEINPALAEILGYDSPQSALREIHSIADQVYVHSEDRQPIVDEQRQSQGVTHHLNRYRRRNGEEFIANLHLRTIVGADRNALYFEGIVEDITERKRAEEALRLSEQEKSLILDNANEIIAFHDTENNLIWANSAYLKSTGLALSELKGHKCYSCWRLDRLCNNCPVVKAIQTGQPQEAELTPENQPHWPSNQGSWHVRATAVRDSAGVIIGGIEIAHEITNRKQAEKALRESEKRYRGVVQNTTAVILRVDTKGIIRFANERALQFFGYAEDELVGEHTVGTIVPEQESTGRNLAAMVDAIAANPDGFHSNANENIRKNGERVWMEWTNSGIYDSDGNLTEFLSVGIDATDRKRAEQELRETQKRLSVIVDSIADGFYALDNDFRFTHINDTALSYFKTRRQDIIGKSLFEVFPKVRGTLFDTRYRRAMETGEAEHFETLSVATGQHVEMHAYPGQGNLTVLFRDITDRKRMEEEQRRLLALAQQRSAETEAVFEALSDAVLIYDKDMNVQRVNPTFIPTYGFDPVGLNVREIVERTQCRWFDGRPFLIDEQPTPRALRGDTVLNQYLLITRHDGCDLALETSASPLRIGDEIVGSVTVWHDITERRQMEEELRKSRDELELRVAERSAELTEANRALREKSKLQEAFFQHTISSLVFLDKSFNFIRVNAAYAKACGKNAEDFPGHNHFELYPHAENQAIFEDVVRTKQFYQALAKPFSFPDHPEWGVTYWDWSLIPIVDDSAEVDFMVFSLMDVTERKRAEEELKSYMQKLQESNQALQDFASVASHDMQEPLRKVISFGKMLKERYGDSLGEEGKDYLERMLRATDRMQGLLTSLLQYARVTTKAEPFREVDLKEIVYDVLSDLEVRISMTGGVVQVDELPTVSADPMQMHQLFQNLIGNALKFHKEREKPVVRVHCRTDNPKSYEIIIEDNGIGFEEKYLERIFAPFQRLHGRSSSYEGTGMGLAICKRIVERHGGSITGRSAPGKGSTFIVSLPMRREGNLG